MAKTSHAKKKPKPRRVRSSKKVIEINSVTVAPETTDVVGRPSEFREEYVEQTRAMCQLGATDRDLAAFFEVSTVTIWNWQAKHPEFTAALKRGKEAADDRVERSLYSRATGYTFDSEKLFMTKDGDVVREHIIEHIPPDVTACIFWLKNRRSSEWRDKTDHDHNHMHALKLQGGTMSIEDAQSLFREARNMTPAEIMKTVEGKRTA